MKYFRNLSLVLLVSIFLGIGGLLCSTVPVKAMDTALDANNAPGPYIGLEVGAYTGLGTRDLRFSTILFLRVAMGFLGIAATIIVLIAGYPWMTAGGNDEKIGQAKKWLTAGVIGMAIIFSAYSISSFVVGQMVKQTINTNFVEDSVK